MLEDKPELLTRSSIELAHAIASRELSPLELLHAVMSRLDETEPAVNAFISRRDEAALAEARTAEREIQAGSYRGPLHGLPIAVKDNLAVEGTVTTAGSKILAGRVTTIDAEAVRRLRAAGAIVVGKTNLHEFAYGATSVNPHYGPTHNPWRLDCISGGSSGGSAAALAAGQVPLAIGTDAAGSIRMPASLCGIVGIKPTFGRVSARGVIASHNSTVDHVGPMARTVADAALLLDVMAGHDPLDPNSSRLPSSPYLRALDSPLDLHGVRIGVPTDYFFDLVDPDVEAVVRKAVGELQRLGATLVEVSFPDLEDMMPLRLALFADGLAFHTRFLRERLNDYGDEIRQRLLVDHFVQAHDVARAHRVRRLLQQQFAAIFRRVDLIATPTTPIAAVPFDTQMIAVPDQARGSEVLQPIGLLLLRLTAPANLTGLPAISVPAGFTPDGRPVGLQLMARPFEEPMLLTAAHVYEQATRWFEQRPPIVPRPEGAPEVIR